VFGMMEAMLSFLRRQVGLRTDSASASGSLHAKVANLINTSASILNKSNIKSIQRGTLEMSVTDVSKNVTISSVNTAKAMVNFLGAKAANDYNTSGSGDAIYAYAYTSHHFVMLQLVNSTTIEISRVEAGRPVTVSWEVIEFY
jgi:hypothetical protein